MNIQGNQEFNKEQFHNYSRTFKHAGKYSRKTKGFSRIKDIISFDSKLKKSLALKDVLQPWAGEAVEELREMQTYEKTKNSSAICLFLFSNNVDLKKITEIMENVLNFVGV